MVKEDFTRRLAEVMESHKQSLFRYACYRTGSVTEAEDILQDVFLRVLERNRDGAEVGNLLAYVFRAVVNACSSRPSLPPSVSLDYADEAAFGSEAESFEEEAARIRMLVDTMPEASREVIRLKIYAGLTFDEVAETLGVSATTAKRRYYEGLEALRKKYNLL